MYQGLNQAQRRMTTFQRNVNSVMSKIAATFGTIKIGETIKNGVQDAMSVETSIDNLNRTMQESSKIFQQWADTQSQAYGMSKQEAYKYGATFSNLISSFQSDAGQITNSTQELMKATAIVASKTGRTFEDTSERIRSGLLGSTEAIEDLGIYTNISMLESTEAFNRLANGKAWRQLDFQTQQQIRLTAILEQAYARYGDTLADTTQSRHNQFIASLKNVQLALGQAFLPIYNAVLPPLTAFMNMLSKAISVIAIFTTAIFGKPSTMKKQTTVTNELGNSVGNLSSAASSADSALNKASKSTKKAATEAKKATKEIGGLIGGLDEINNLSVSTTAGSSGSDGSNSGASSTPTAGGLTDLGTIDMGDAIDTSGLDKKVEKIKKTFDKIKKIISDNKDIIISLMTGLMAGLGVILISKWGKIGRFFAANFPLLTKIFSKLGKVIFKPFSLLKQGIQVLLGLNPIVAAVAIAITILVSALTYLWRTNEDFRKKVIKTWKVIKETLQPWLEGLWTIFKVLAEIVGTVLGAAFKFLGKVIVKVVEVLANGFMDSILQDAPKLKKMGEGFKKFAKNLEKGWKMIKRLGFAKTMKILLNKLKKIIKDKLKEIKDEFIKKVKKHFKEMGKNIKKKWEELTKPVGDFVLDIKSKVEDFKEKVSEKWEDLQDGFKDKVLEIGAKVDDFKEKASDKWDGVKDWFKDKVLGVNTDVEEFEPKVSDELDKSNKTTSKKKISIKNIVEDIQGNVSEAWEKANKWISEKKIQIKNSVDDFKDKVQDKWKEVNLWVSQQKILIGNKVEDFKEKASENLDIAKQWISTQVLNLSTKVDGFKEKASLKASEAVNWIKTQALNLGTKVGSFYDKAKINYDSAKKSIKSWSFSIGSKVDSFYTKAKINYDSAKKSIKSWSFSVSTKVGSFTTKLKDAYNSAKKTVKSWSFSIALKITSSASSIKTAVNNIIKSINNNVLGKIKIKLPGILGGGTWTAPKIPYLAKGGIVDSATLAVVGEAGRKILRSIVEMRYKKIFGEFMEG